MPVVQLSNEQIQSLRIHQNLDKETLTAEIIRAELWARRICTRRTLCLRVSELLMHLSIQYDYIREVLVELEDNGDVLLGENGQVAAAPLRMIELSQDTYLFVGGPDSSKIESILSSSIQQRRITRKATKIEQGKIELLLETVGGAILTPERWSGIERAPKADSHWISELQRELDANGKSPMSLESNCDPWQPYCAINAEKSARTRWKKAETGRLWRAKHRNGYWIYVWTDGQQPGLEKHIRLSTNNATRTRFALDLEANNPYTFYLEKISDRYRLELVVRIPQEEYRYLQTIADSTDSSTVFEIRPEFMDRTRHLFDRLGIILTEQGEKR